MKFFVIWLLLLFVLATVLLISYYFYSHRTHPYDFCNPNLCDPGQHHVGCRSPGFAKNCVKPRLITLTKRLKRLVLDNHNSLRSNLAAGNVTGFKPAVRLATLQWDNDLAYLAVINSKYCTMRYDECHSTEDYRYPGQNIAGIPVTDKRQVNVITINKFIVDAINLWFMEFNKANQEIMDDFKTDGGTKIQNFSNIVHERTTVLGCGMNSYFNSQKQLWVLLVCNYSFRPYPGLPIYTSGPSCSKCKTGCNTKQYRYLCNRAENIRSVIN